MGHYTEVVIQFKIWAAGLIKICNFSF